MNELCREGGAVFFSTHVLDIAEKLCNKVAMIDHGKIAAYGDMEAVLGSETLEEFFMDKIDSNKKGNGVE